MKTRSQSAFTLIEMLVVISIIAVLAAFAVPALTSALTKGQMTGTLNNGRQLYLAAQQLKEDRWRDQSHDAPSFLSCWMMMPPYFSFQSQIFATIASRPRSSRCLISASAALQN